MRSRFRPPSRDGGRSARTASFPTPRFGSPPTLAPDPRRDPLASARADRRIPRWPWLIVGAAVAWNLVSLRAVTLGVSYLDDSSVHEQMARFATMQFRSGHLPVTSWFPFLGLGSPQFLHYQSLPAMLTSSTSAIRVTTGCSRSAI